MVLIGVNTADLAGLNEVSGKGVNVVGYVAQGPILNLNGISAVVADFDVFIWFAGSTAIKENVDNLDVTSGGGRLRGGGGGCRR